MDRTILVLEDHRETRDLIKAALESEGFKAACNATVKEGKEFIKHHKPVLAILDLSLPDGNGLEICRLIRGSIRLANTPIIALTGLTGLSDKKKGFETGVDQYLGKPLEVEELLLWVKALLRRTQWNTHGWALPAFGDLRICAESYLVRFRDSAISNLTRREFELFYFLVRTAPRLASRQTIIEEAWETASVDNLVDTHIHNLRGKLPRQLAARIQSVPGKGFRYFQTARQDSSPIRH